MVLDEELPWKGHEESRKKRESMPADITPGPGSYLGFDKYFYASFGSILMGDRASLLVDSLVILTD